MIKKLIILLVTLVLFTGCSCQMNDSKPEEAVETLFEKYRAKDDDVITQLIDTIGAEELTDDAKQNYQDLMEKQYDQLAYVIKDINEREESATATVELTVLNYKSAILKAEDELKQNPEKFNDENGTFSEEKYMNYKIEKMNEVTEMTTHTIDLSLTKEDGMWKVDELTGDDISKLHGLF